MVREPPADLREPGADPAATAVIGTPPRKRRPSLKIAVDADEEDEEEVEGDTTTGSVLAMDLGGNGARFGGELIEDEEDEEDTVSTAAGIAFAKMFCVVCDCATEILDSPEPIDLNFWPAIFWYLQKIFGKVHLYLKFTMILINRVESPTTKLNCLVCGRVTVKRVNSLLF